MNELIKAKSNFKKVELEFKAAGKGVEKATRSAINSVAAQGKTKASKTIRAVYNIKAKDVNKTLTVIRVNATNKEAKIISKGYKALSLGKFKPTQTKKGVEVKIKMTNKKGLVRGAFKATMPSGHQGVFKRHGEKREMTRGRYKGKERQPIQDKFAIGVPIMFRAKAVMPKVQRFIREKFPIILKSKLEYFNK